jgi:hypothetical protein
MEVHYIAAGGKESIELVNGFRKNIGKVAQQFHGLAIPV